MRIIAGIHRSRVLATLAGDATRPTSDKIKAAVFSSTGPYFDGGVFLDLFSGSGSLALEAISRGMDFAYCVDASKDACKIIHKNISALKENDKASVIQSKAEDAIQSFTTKQLKFDYIYMDPPYSLHNQQAILTQLLDSNILKEDGILVLESQKDVSFELTNTYKVVKEASYGITTIRYIRRN